MFIKKFKKVARKCIRKLSGTEIKLQIRKRIMWCGSNYGGFYVVPEFFKAGGYPVVYSFGIGEDISFDLDMINKFHAEVWGFDPTPKSIRWIKNQKISKRFHFYEFGLSDKDGIEKFYLPQNEEYVSGSTYYREMYKKESIEVEMRCFRTILEELKHDVIDVVKLDIEGSEFAVIDDILESDVEIRQICIEVHGRMFEDGKEKTKELIRKLNLYGYKVCAVSNNEEITLLKC